MIKVNELRIGNLVYFLGNVHEIEGISKRLRPDVGHFQLSGIEYSQKGFHLKPIPLTEEWLVKFGFIEHEVVKCLYNKTHNGFEIDITIEGDNVLSVQLSSTNISGAYPNKELFKYVHQLQNLYFALTGEEFTIKE